MGSAPHRPPLFMLHGIKSDGRWQQMIPKLISPLFRCMPLVYRDYQFPFGAPKLVFWPWAVPLSFFMSAYCGGWFGGHAFVPIIMVALVIIICDEGIWCFRPSYSDDSVEGEGEGEGAGAGSPSAAFAMWASIPVVIAVAAVLAQYLLIKDAREFVLWIGLVTLVVYQEGREALSSTLDKGSQGHRFSHAWSGTAMYLVFLWVAGVVLWRVATFHRWLGITGAQTILFGFAFFVEPKVRRHRVVAKIRSQIERAWRSDDQYPCLIAHSFGTLLIRHVMESIPGLRIDKLILVGCVLREDFDWNRLLNRSHILLTQVRNECGGKDSVVKVWAYWAGWIFRWTELGRAGCVGFKGNPSTVHNIDGPLGLCKDCEEVDRPAQVHNVPLERYGHSDWFLSEHHVKHLWLPYLWDIIPSEYADFHNVCIKIHNAQKAGDWSTFQTNDLIMREKAWSWGPNGDSGRTLEKHIAENLRRECPIEAYDDDSALKKAKEIESDVVVLLSEAVVRALRELEAPEPRNRELIQWSLNPARAITQAVRREMARRQAS